MMRKAPAASMQKTYDECYLTCSTAIYFESQNNEAEALRSWRTALDQIYYHNAYRMPSNYRPRSETEKALQDSLRNMEVQCKERVDLLDALKKSRQEAEKAKEGENGTTYAAPARETAQSPAFSITPLPHKDSNGWLGQGTVPTVSISDLPKPAPIVLSRPPPPKIAPSRPSYTSRIDSDRELPRAQSLTNNPFADFSQASLAPPPPGEQPRRGSRTPSPEKRPGMLRTLRSSGGRERTSSGRMPSSLRDRPPAASAKAATLAFGPPPQQRPSYGSVDQAHGDTASGSYVGANRTWDPYTRTLVQRAPSRDTLKDYNRHISDTTVVRPPSPADHMPTRGHDSPDEFGTTNIHSPLYPEYHTMNPYAKQAFSHSGESIETQKPPQQNRALPPVPTNEHAEPTRRSSPPKLPKIDQSMLSYRKEYPTPTPSNPKKPPTVPANKSPERDSGAERLPRSGPGRTAQAKPSPMIPRKAVGVASATSQRQRLDNSQPLAGPSRPDSATSNNGLTSRSDDRTTRPQRHGSPAGKTKACAVTPPSVDSADDDHPETSSEQTVWEEKVKHLMKHLPKGVDEGAAKQIFNEIVIQGDEVHWDDVAGLEIAKDALKETVVYPFLRPDLFMGLREPARGMLLFGPPGTGKTMLARAVATESKSTFFAISASSLTSKFLGESEKLVRALFSIAKALAPSIIFVDEIDSLLSSRGGSSEHEATRRIKTEFLIQWSDLAKAAAGQERSDKDKERGDASRVLVLAATNLPWAIDEAARRRFVRRQYIPLPEEWVREKQLRHLLASQKHGLGDRELRQLVRLTDGFSGSDITALAKDAAMGPLRSLGEKLLHMSPDDIRPISMEDFQASLVNIRPSVSRQGLKEFEDWARQFGERGG